ncbi:hypothetical protein PANDA_005701 [Ailuropoda melanoleuca]|uniref:EGF-like domain-containing protein n=1 Tax=Ailuropoda melanoleuca TaxID=9646 RepID=D2H6S4_AILME|nr:hypothetical protein PANDA_005701 [Ailuropoda melanoleuca]
MLTAVYKVSIPARTIITLTSTLKHSDEIGHVQGVRPPGTYGKDCKQVCRCSAENEECHPVTGRCTCLPGYHGNRCHLLCPEDHYRQDCVQQRSCGSGQCDPVTGGCQCPPSQMGARCQQACLPGFYSLNCAHICDNKNGASCDTESGLCICPAGFHGSQYEKECRSGQYGPHGALKRQCTRRAHRNPRHGSCTCPLKRVGPTCEENDLDNPQ